MTVRVGIFGRTPLLARGIARVASCGGAATEIVSNLEDMGRVIGEGAGVVCVDDEALESLLPVLAQHPSTQVLVCTNAQNGSDIGALKDMPQVNHVFGLRYPDAPPRNWELLAVVRRLVSAAPPPAESYLDWGGGRFERSPASDKDRDEIVAEVEAFAKTLTTGRIAGTMGEVAHELLMNAMYDAPVDARGTPLYAHDRTASIQLPPEQRPRFLCGSDGSRIVLSVADPFGRLRREHIFGGLARALAGGTMDTSGGGAGLGFMVMYKATTLLFFDVQPGKTTQATAILELDVPQRELRNLPRSVHFFREER